MKQSTKDRAKGKFHEVKGKVKEKVGRMTNNPNLEAEGQGEQVGGKIRKKIGQVEKVVGTVVWRGSAWAACENARWF